MPKSNSNNDISTLNAILFKMITGFLCGLGNLVLYFMYELKWSQISNTLEEKQHGSSWSIIKETEKSKTSKTLMDCHKLPNIDREIQCMN
jgi:hypothetical protein